MVTFKSYMPVGHTKHLTTLRLTKAPKPLRPLRPPLPSGSKATGTRRQAGLRYVKEHLISTWNYKLPARKNKVKHVTLPLWPWFVFWLVWQFLETLPQWSIFVCKYAWQFLETLPCNQHLNLNCPTGVWNGCPTGVWRNCPQGVCSWDESCVMCVYVQTAMPGMITFYLPLTINDWTLKNECYQTEAVWRSLDYRFVTWRQPAPVWPRSGQGCLPPKIDWRCLHVKSRGQAPCMA